MSGTENGGLAVVTDERKVYLLDSNLKWWYLGGIDGDVRLLQVRDNQIHVTTSEASLFVFRVDVPRDHFTTSHLKFALPKDSSLVKASDKYLM